MKVSPDCLIFLHIPKTAGSTFHAVLNSHYPQNNIYNIFGGRLSDPQIIQFINASNQIKRDILLLKGHMPFGLHQYLPSHSQYISMLRNPIERVISQYYYIKKRPSNPLHNQINHENMSIRDFLFSGISVGMNNGQCRFLNGDIDIYSYNKCDNSLLESAIEHIEKHFIWVGITERFDESLLALSKLLEWKSHPNYISQNVSKSRKSTKDIDQKDIDAIMEYNSYDIQLYEYANNLLDENVNKVVNFYNELELFQKKNQKLKKYFAWLPDRLNDLILKAF